MTTSARWLALIVLISMLLRVAVAFYLGDSTPPGKDETSYAVLAERLATGHGYSFPVAWYPFAEADTPTSHWSFLYTAIVAAIFDLFGANPAAVRVLQALVCGVLTPWLTFRLTRRAFPALNDAPALLAALLAAIYAYFVVYGAMIQTEALYICVVLWSLERSLALDAQLASPRGAGSTRRKLGWMALVLGLSLGVATLLRQSILPWVPVLFLWLLITGWRARRLQAAVGAIAISSVVLALCIAPFTLRNQRVYGDFLLLNSNTGYAMYSAQHPMHGNNFQAYAAAPLPADLVGKGLNEPQWDRALLQRGFSFVVADPGRYLLLSLSRVRDYFEFWPTTDSSLLFNMGRLVSFTLFLPFMLLGIYGAWKRRKLEAHAPGPLLLPDPVALLLLFVLFYSLLHILTWAMTRYRLPVDAALLPFAALGVQTCARWLGRQASKDNKAAETLPA